MTKIIPSPHHWIMVTGVNNNHLQGVMGVLLMSVLAFWIQERTERSRHI
ncbi:hypothetical protein [Nostoc sp.]